MTDKKTGTQKVNSICKQILKLTEEDFKEVKVITHIL